MPTYADSMASHRYGPTFDRARLVALARDGYTCHWCGGPARTADHVVPRAEGGPDTADNLVAACQPCNSRRSLEWVKARARRRRNPATDPTTGDDATGARFGGRSRPGETPDGSTVVRPSHGPTGALTGR